jgi:hypothetical protein
MYSNGALEAIFVYGALLSHSVDGFRSNLILYSSYSVTRFSQDVCYTLRSYSFAHDFGYVGVHLI